MKRAYEDPVLIKDSRILETLLLTEERDMELLPSSNFFDCYDGPHKEREIKSFMRKIVANWMLEVCEEQRCEEEVFPLAMNYLDRILKLVNVKKSQLQLLGATCMFIASKLKETIPLTGEKLVIYTDNSITLQDLMDFEMLVLNRLKWDLSAITAHDFLEQILNRLPHIDNERALTIKRHAQTFIALCATEFKFTSYPPSMIAASSISAAAVGLFGGDLVAHMRLHEDLQHIIRSDADCLRECQKQIEQELNRSLPHPPHAPAQPATAPSSTNSSKCQNGQPTTPTDVRDVMI